MKTATIVWIVIIMVLALAGVWYYTSSPYNANQVNTGNPPASEAAPVLAVARDAVLGDILVASNGMTLYLYTPDTENVSNCYGTCAVNWPPYVRPADEPLVAGTGVTGTIATTERTDGTKQITYNGVPLYFWIKDTKPGDTTGQNVGGVWFIVHP